jgi:hypothetical protein
MNMAATLGMMLGMKNSAIAFLTAAGVAPQGHQRDGSPVCSGTIEHQPHRL